MWFSVYECNCCDHIFLLEDKGYDAKRCPHCGTTDEFDYLEGQDEIEVDIVELRSNENESSSKSKDE